MNAIGMGGLLNLMDLDIVTGGTRARGLGRDAGSTPVVLALNLGSPPAG